MTHHQIPILTFGTAAPSHCRVGLGIFRCFAILAAGICLDGCTLFLPTDESDTDTVPLIIEDQASIDIDEEGEEDGPAVASETVDVKSLLGLEIDPDQPDSDPKLESNPSGIKSSTDLISFRPRRNNPADAWAAPVSPAKVDPGSAAAGSPQTTIDLPLTGSSGAVERNGAILTLEDFRNKVFAVQQRQEAARFREAIGMGPEKGASKITTGVSGFLGEGTDTVPLPIPPTPDSEPAPDEAAPKAEGVGSDPEITVDSPKVKAAYQVYRWNLMETLADAERAYWRLHYADLQFEEVKKSVNTLAGINDKARLGVLRKTRDISDIGATETLRAQRENSLAEAEAMRTAALMEVTSFLNTDIGTAGSRQPTPIRTEDPPLSDPPPVGISMVAQAKKSHPLYLAERLRVDGTPGAAEEIEDLDSRLEERIEAALKKVRAAHVAIKKSESAVATFAVGLEENLRQFGNGIIGLEGITAFEKSLLAAGQSHLNAQWEYQNAQLDYQLEIGNFLESRNQESPLATLIAK